MTGTKQIVTFFSLFLMYGLSAQNSMVGDGFGGRLWYKPCKYAVGSYSAYTICGDSAQLYSWGSNFWGELGNGKRKDKAGNKPVKVLGMNNVRYYTNGYIASAIKNDSSGWLWGFMLDSFPRKVISNVKFTDAGSEYCSFVKYDGTVWSLGGNFFGCYGNDSWSNSINAYPSQAKGITNAVRVAVGSYNLVILLADGTVMVTGKNQYGGLGNSTPTGNYTYRAVPIPKLKNIVDVKANQFTNMALDSAGRVFTWGNLLTGCLGNGSGKFQDTPVHVSALKDIVAISACDDGVHFMALDKNQNCYVWGTNNLGCMGIGSTKISNVPILVQKNVIDIMAGETFSYIMKSDGSLWASGSNLFSIGNFGNIWMNLKDTMRDTFTRMDPTMAPMYLCKPIVKRDSSKLDFDFNSQCLGDSTYLRVSLTKSFSEFSWNFGDGSKDSGMAVSVHKFKRSDTFNVGVSALNINSLKRDTVWHRVQIYNKPHSDFSINDTLQCLNKNSFIFSDISLYNGDGQLKRQWSLDSSNTFNDSVLVKSFINPGRHMIHLISKTDMNCIDSISKFIYIFPNPKVRINVNNDTQCLNHQNFIFKSDTAFAKYYWQFGDGASDSNSTARHIFKKNGLFTVSLQVSDNNTCSATDSSHILVWNSVTISKVDNDTQCFSGNTFSFSANSGKISYNWHMGDGKTMQIQSFQYSYTMPGTYNVQLESTDSLSCISDDSLLISVLQNPKADFYESNNICSSKRSYINQSKNAYQSQWLVDSAVIDSKDLDYGFTNKGNKSVTLIVCDLSGKCNDTITKNSLILETDIDKLNVPNVFTPGNDYYNDSYTLGGIDAACIESAEIEIFDRWGILVFKGDLKHAGWNGRLNNTSKELPAGVYYYLLNVKLLSGAGTYSKKVNGVIHLIR